MPATFRPVKTWTIGSAADCDLVVSAATVSGHHCTLTQYAAENGNSPSFALLDSGSTNGTFVNGGQLEKGTAAWVTSQDQITLGRNTVMPWPETAGSAPPNNGQAISMPATIQREIRIGRSPDSQKQLDYPQISWNHARIVEDTSGSYFIEDLGSTNGVALNQIENRVRVARLSLSDTVYFGSLKVPAEKLIESKKLALGNDAARASVSFAGERMVIGRDPNCDYPLPYPMISWHHAELMRESGGIFVQDLGSVNGTFLDGVRITSRVKLEPGHEVGLGSYRFTLLDAGGKLERREYKGNVTIQSLNVVVDIPGKSQAQKRLLNPLSLTLYPSELTALMGPAGAGKTTYLKALNGYTRPSEGSVAFNGVDLHTHYERFRLLMGYVPQDDIMHAGLQVSEALYFTARLRTDLKDSEITARINTILRDLGIDDIGGREIGSPEKKVISGGQRKRVNVAMELLSDPDVLFLDEPTTGLSAGDAAEVVRLLRKLANQGKTIVATIHQPSLEIYKEFDNLLLISRDKGNNPGALAYFGPAWPDSFEFFDEEGYKKAVSQNKEPSPEAIFAGLKRANTDTWARKFAASKYKREFVDNRAGQLPSIPSARASDGSISRKFSLNQWWTLVRRNMILKVRDRLQTGILLAQAPVIGIILAMIVRSLTPTKANFASFSNGAFHSMTDWLSYSGRHNLAQFIMVLVAVWFGCNNAAREIVGERAIYMRERMVSLKLPSYVFSKLFVLGAFCILQCLVLLGIIYAGCGLNGPFGQMFLVLFLSSMVGVALGLLISSIVKSTEAAIGMLPLLLVPMLMFSGGVRPIYEMVKPLQVVATIFPTRWAFEANVLLESKYRKERLEVEGCDPNPSASRATIQTRQPRRTRASAAPAALPPCPPARDVADTAFPREHDGKHYDRTSFRSAILILAFMFTALIAATLGVLKSSDIR